MASLPSRIEGQRHRRCSRREHRLHRVERRLRSNKLEVEPVADDPGEQEALQRRRPIAPQALQRRHQEQRAGQEAERERQGESERRRLPLHVLRAAERADEFAPGQSTERHAAIVMRADEQPRRGDGGHQRHAEKRAQAPQPVEPAVEHVERNDRRQRQDRHRQRIEQHAAALRRPERQRQPDVLVPVAGGCAVEAQQRELCDDNRQQQRAFGNRQRRLQRHDGRHGEQRRRDDRAALPQHGPRQPPRGEHRQYAGDERRQAVGGNRAPRVASEDLGR